MKNEKVILLTKKGTASQMYKKEYTETAEYARMFGGFISGKFKKGKPEGMTARVKGIFTATDGREFLIYSDDSANAIENTDANGFPK